MIRRSSACFRAFPTSDAGQPPKGLSRFPHTARDTGFRFGPAAQTAAASNYAPDDYTMTTLILKVAMFTRPASTIIAGGQKKP